MMSQLTKFKRLDKHLVETGLVATPQRAQELIRSGAVSVNGAVITAIQCPINEDHKIAISGIDSPWVAPDAIRLFEALEILKINVRGQTVVDIGTGTGGFTEVLLQKGAKKVYAVEKEAMQLDPSLSLNQRIKNLHTVHARDLEKKHIESDFDLVVADIGSANFLEEISPVLRLSNTNFDFLAFIDNKKTAKELERILRTEFSLMIKRVPDSLQKDSALLWMQKKI